MVLMMMDFGELAVFRLKNSNRWPEYCPKLTIKLLRFFEGQFHLFTRDYEFHFHGVFGGCVAVLVSTPFRSSCLSMRAEFSSIKAFILKKATIPAVTTTVPVPSHASARV